jgi:hypothetical protein
MCRRFGSGAIIYELNSNDPGDALWTAVTISSIFGLMAGQIFDPGTTIEILQRAGLADVEYSDRT